MCLSQLDAGFERQALDLASAVSPVCDHFTGLIDAATIGRGEPRGGTVRDARNAFKGTAFSVTLLLQDMGEANGA